jgi:hypothetical protein
MRCFPQGAANQQTRKSTESDPIHMVKKVEENKKKEHIYIYIHTHTHTHIHNHTKTPHLHT